VSQRFLSVGLHTVSQPVLSVRPPESVFFALKSCHVRQNPVSTFAYNIVHLSGLTATRTLRGLPMFLPGDVPPIEPAFLRHTIIPLNNYLHPHLYFTFALTQILLALQLNILSLQFWVAMFVNTQPQEHFFHIRTVRRCGCIYEPHI
jgi:hypothetical protein